MSCNDARGEPDVMVTVKLPPKIVIPYPVPQLSP